MSMSASAVAVSRAPHVPTAMIASGDAGRNGLRRRIQRPAGRRPGPRFHVVAGEENEINQVRGRESVRDVEGHLAGHESDV